MPAPATAGANRATYGVPVPRVAAAPAPSTTTVAITQPSSSDGVVTSARARPAEPVSRAASRSAGPGRRRQTSAATPVHTRLRSTSDGQTPPPSAAAPFPPSRDGAASRYMPSPVTVHLPPAGRRAARPAAAAWPGGHGSSPSPPGRPSAPPPPRPACPPHTSAATPHDPGCPPVPGRRPRPRWRPGTPPPPQDRAPAGLPQRSPRTAPGRQDRGGAGTTPPDGGQPPTATRPPRTAPTATGPPATGRAGRTRPATPRHRRPPPPRSAHRHPSLLYCIPAPAGSPGRRDSHVPSYMAGALGGTDSAGQQALPSRPGYPRDCSGRRRAAAGVSRLATVATSDG